MKVPARWLPRECRPGLSLTLLIPRRRLASGQERAVRLRRRRRRLFCFGHRPVDNGTASVADSASDGLTSYQES